MQYDNYIKAKLVDYIYCHCGHNNALNGLKAHAFNLRNRVQNGWGSWLEVIEHADDYAGNEKITNPSPTGNDVLWIKLLSAIDSIYDYSEPDKLCSGLAGTTEGLRVVSGLYVVDFQGPVRQWFRDNVQNQKPSHKIIGTVGTLTVFS